MFDERHDLIAEVARELRRTPVGDDAAMKARIMAAVQGAEPRSRLSVMWRWLAAPRPVRVSPLAALATAAGLALVMWALQPRSVGTPTRTAVVAAVHTQATGQRVVQFVLVAPSASHVALVGDFNGWDARTTPLSRSSARGVWTVELPLVPGRHAYAFVVDDSTWVADPGAPRAPGDDFGAPSSVIVVGGGIT